MVIRQTGLAVKNYIADTQSRVVESLKEIPNNAQINHSAIIEQARETENASSSSPSSFPRGRYSDPCLKGGLIILAYIDPTSRDRLRGMIYTPVETAFGASLG